MSLIMDEVHSIHQTDPKTDTALCVGHITYYESSAGCMKHQSRKTTGHIDKNTGKLFKIDLGIDLSKSELIQ
jgi:hypothetical protein